MDEQYDARIAALEAKVARLYEVLDLVEPSSAEAVAGSLPDGVQRLAREGRREEAIRQLLVDQGGSLKDAASRVTGFLRSIGH
ncbi:MAG TPA: hypothetical protein VIL55_15010 [Naasia sp.]